MLPFETWPPVRWEMTAAGEEGGPLAAGVGAAEAPRTFAISYAQVRVSLVFDKIRGGRDVCTHTDVIFELNTPGRIQLNLLQGLSHDIVWLALALLGRFDGGCLIDIALIVDVKLAECIR